MTAYLRLLKKYFGVAEIFIVISMVFGLFFVVRTPMLWGTDETSHVARIYQLSEGHLWAQHFADTREEGGYGGYLPQNLYELIVNVNRDLMDNETHNTYEGTKNVDDPQLYRDFGKQHFDTTQRHVYAFPNTAAYSPVAYGPGLLGMVVARSIDVNIYWTIIMVRLFDLVFFVALVYGALRILSGLRAQWLIFVVALLPTTLYSASIMSADGVLTAVVLLFAALLIKVLCQPKGSVLQRHEIALLMGITLLMPLVKPGYVLLLPLQLLIPSYKFPSRQLAYLCRWLPLAIAALLFVWWSHATSGAVADEALIRPGYNWQLVVPDKQAEYLAHHPLSFVPTIIRTLLIYDNKYFMELIGDLGFQHIRLPGLGVAAQVLVLILAVFVSGPIRGAKKVPVAVGGVILATAMLIAVGFYLTYTDVGASVIVGIQGRYFTPMLPFILGLLAMIPTLCMSVGKQNRESYRVATRIIVVLVVMILTLMALKFQYVTWGGLTVV